MDKVRFGYDINEVKSLKNQEVAWRVTTGTSGF